MFKLRKLRIEREQLKVDRERVRVRRAEVQLAESRLCFLPHIMVNTSVFREGNRWVCSALLHPEEGQNIIAYGESPAQACSNFDALWQGAPGFILEDQEDQEEEY